MASKIVVGKVAHFINITLTGHSFWGLRGRRINDFVSSAQTRVEKWLKQILMIGSP
jgi:hypothetical protein